MDFTHDHGYIDRLDAYHAVTVHAFDINLFSRIVGPDHDECLVVDFFYRERDADALIVGAGVNDDLGGVFHAGACQHVAAGRLAAHEVNEIRERIPLRALRTQHDFHAARLLVGDQLPDQRGSLAASIPKDHNVLFHIEPREPLFPPLDEISNRVEHAAQGYGSG